MQKLILIRLAVLIVMRDFLIPMGGLTLAIILPLTHSLSPWHLPLIAGMLGTPLVARGTPIPGESRDSTKELPSTPESATEDGKP